MLHLFHAHSVQLALVSKVGMGLAGAVLFGEAALDGTTHIPLGAVWVFVGSILGGCGVLLGCCWWLGRQLQKFEDFMEHMKEHCPACNLKRKQ